MGYIGAFTALVGNFIRGVTAGSFTPTDSTVPANGIYLPASNTVGIATNSAPRVTIDSSGNVELKAQADLRFADSDSSNWVAFQGPSTVSTNVTWTLPAADGSSSQVLSTNGSGTLSWTTVAAGATVTTSDTPPVSPNDGDLWWDSIGGRLYVYYQDVNGSQWVDTSPQGGASISRIEQGNTSAEVTDTGSNGTFAVTTEGTVRFRVESTGETYIAGSLVLEGTTDDAFEATISCDPTADRTLTLPDATTTLAGLAVTQSFTAAQRGSVVVLTPGATVTPNFSAGNNFSLALNQNTTLANPTNLTAGQSGSISITQDATARTLSYGNYFYFDGGVPSLGTTTGAISTLVYYVDSSTHITAQLINEPTNV